MNNVNEYFYIDRNSTMAFWVKNHDALKETLVRKPFRQTERAAIGSYNFNFPISPW